MGAQENELTLEGLAQRLQTLERENETLRTKVAILSEPGTRSTEVPELRGSEPSRDREAALAFDRQVSRKWLLSKAGAAAVGGVAAGALMLRDTREASASHNNNHDPIDVPYVLTHRLWATGERSDLPTIYGSITSDSNAAISGINSGSAPGVQGKSQTAAIEGIATGISGTGVEGKTEGSNGTGVKGTGRYGVWGESNQAGFHGVTGRNTRTDGTGVRGVGAKRGVLGESTNGTGVYGTSSAPTLGAIEGHNDGGGTGVVGVGKVGMLAFSHTNGWNAVWGRHTTNGRGVAGDSPQGVGVSGESTGGIGGEFKGGKAQLRLVPGSVAGKPTSGSHTKGEVYMDSKGTLFVCTAGDGTTVGTWKKVNMKLV